MHPFASLAPHLLRKLFYISLAATISIAVVLNVADEPLVTSLAPYGIVSFELAGTPERAQAIIESWDERARLFAAFSLGYDYLYMLAYSTVLGLGCILAAQAIRSVEWPLAALGIPLAWGMWLAALFDAVENLSLILILLAGASSGIWPAVARQCALIKFGLLFFGLVYAFYGLVVGIVGRLKH